MSLQQQIQDDLKASMKARDKTRTSTLRMALSALRNKAVEENLGPEGELSDEQVEAVLSKQVKQHEEAAEGFRDGGRDEQAAAEEAEAGILREYLPEPLGDEELDGLIDEAIDEVGAQGPGDMGPVMGAVMPRVGSRADGDRVSERVRERLSG